MVTYLVSYDIADPKRLRRVAKICEDFGRRRQFSVFLVRVSPTEMARLRQRLYDAVDLARDQILFVPVCAACSRNIEALGRPTDPAELHDAVVVI